MFLNVSIKEQRMQKSQKQQTLRFLQTAFHLLCLLKDNFLLSAKGSVAYRRINQCKQGY